MQAAEAEQFLSTVFKPLLSVHSSSALYSEALRLYGKNGLSWYDSLIVSAAMQSECDFLLTEDLQHGQRFGTLRITNPFL
jgi:predicted nucleic acid-binding protein